MKDSKKIKAYMISLLFCLIFVYFTSGGFSEVKTTYTEAEYWKSTTNNNEVVKRNLIGRAINHNIFSIKNVSFNRTHHAFGRGDILAITFDIYNNMNKPFEGYMFVVADTEQRFRKGAHFYVLISKISPDPTGKTKDFHIASGVLPEYATKIASSKDNSELIGVLTKEELMNNYSKNPAKGIPIKVSSQTQIAVNHFMPYSREEKFYNNVLILIYGKEKQKLISYELEDDPKKIGAKRLVHIQKDDKNKTSYILKEHHPLLFVKRYKLTKR